MKILLAGMLACFGTTISFGQATSKPQLIETNSSGIAIYRSAGFEATQIQQENVNLEREEIVFEPQQFVNDAKMKVAHYREIGELHNAEELEKKIKEVSLTYNLN